MLSLRSTAACSAPNVPTRRGAAPARRAVVAVRAAGLGDALQSIGESFVRIFSKPQDKAPNGDWSGTSSPFSGRVDRDRRGRPFADGFATKAVKQAAPGAQAQDASDAPASEGGAPQEGYLDGAVQGLMGKNFSGKEDAERPAAGSQGWQGDLHGRKTDGFHSRKV